MQVKPLPTPSPDNAQIREYTAAVKKGYSSLFVAHRNGRWVVTRAISKDKIGEFPTRAEAVHEAAEEANKVHSVYYVHDGVNWVAGAAA